MGEPTAPAAVTRPLKFRPAVKGRRADAQALAEITQLLGDSPRRRDLLIEHLHKIQDHFGHLHSRHLVALAQDMRLSMAEVYEVATFYHHFDVVRDGEQAPASLTVRVCESLSCSMAGAASLRAEVAQRLGPGVRVIAAPCIGRCEQAPAVTIGQHPLPHAKTDTVCQHVDNAATRHPAAKDDSPFEPSNWLAPTGTPGALPDIAPAYAGLDTYLEHGGYALWRACMRGEREVSAVIAELESSGLRGLGGAGFPAGRKWRTVREQPGPRLIAVNIDEGEPGTFKDRTWLERDPHRFIEGLLIASWAIDAQACYVYLRDEYHGCRGLLEHELARLRAAPPFGLPLPEIHLRRGAGAYICGEESAMIESIEGKRGLPRLRPPYVAQVGLFGRPTLEHNLETLYWVRDILERGAAWFSSFGRRERRGLRSFSVSGRVVKPGVHLAPAGISVRELIAEYCGGMQPGHTLYAYLPGGASGGILPESLADLPLDFDTLQPYGCFIGSAAVIVLSQHDRVLDAALNMLGFFRDESCGQCTPCRVGSAKLHDLLRQIGTPRWNEALARELAATMADASICGLGQAAPNPLLSLLRYVPHELSGAST
jgi:formate dehydrogenase